MTDELKQWEFDRGYAKGKADVLEKIRAEVLRLTDGYTAERIWNVDVLQIIDKYREEIENGEVT